MRHLPPRWYLPPGVAEPPHLAHEPIRLRAAAGASAGGLAPGGVFVGGAPRDGEDLAAWRVHSGGWAYALERCDPLAFVRVDALPLPEWTTIPAPTGGRWRVPVLLRVVRGADGQPRDLVPATPRVWRGDRWELPPEVAGPAQALVALALRVGDGEPLPLDDGAAVELALQLLALGHRFDREELAGAGLLSDHTVAAALLAACGEWREREEAAPC